MLCFFKEGVYFTKIYNLLIMILHNIFLSAMPLEFYLCPFFSLISKERDKVWIIFNSVCQIQYITCLCCLSFPSETESIIVMIKRNKSNGKVTSIKTMVGFPWWSRGQDPLLPLQGAQTLSLVGKLRSHML